MGKTMSIAKIKNLNIADVMLTGEAIPIIGEKSLLIEALEAMNRAHLGIVCVVDGEGILMAVLTDGDIRRMLLKIQKPFSAFFGDDVINHSVRDPISVNLKMSLEDAVILMENKKIWDLPVVDEEKKLVGLFHLHNAIKIILEKR
jgi:arabinose-5-phosphate isomerase